MYSRGSILAQDYDLINSYLIKYTNSINTPMQSILNKLWIEESTYNKSKLHYLLLHYNLAFTYVLNIYLEYRLGFETDCSYYIEKYEITKYKEYFKCNNIYLDDLFAIFEMPFTNESSTGMMNGGKLETNFAIESVLVEETVEDLPQIDIQNLSSSFTFLLDSVYPYRCLRFECDPTGEGNSQALETNYLLTENSNRILWI